MNKVRFSFVLPNLEPDRVCVGGEGRRKDPGGQLAGPPAPQGARQADQGNILMQFLQIILLYIHAVPTNNL